MKENICLLRNLGNISIGGQIKRLIEDYNIVVRQRPLMQNEGTHTVRYEIQDNFIRFWFNYFERYRSLIEIKNFDGLRSIITSDYTTYSGIMLERYFMQKLAESKQFSAIGSWWEHKGTQNEIDIVALKLEKKTFMNMTKKRTKSNLKIHSWGKLSLDLIVVFLGVTAGFLLNNWRMNAHDKQLEKSYLAGLVDDATQNQIKIQSSIAMDSLWLSRATPLLAVFAQENFPIDSAKSAIELIIIFHRFEANTNTYQNIINSGNMSIIRNFDFRKQIIDYQNAINELSALDEIYYTFYRDYTIPLVIKEFNLASGTLVSKSISNPVMLSNILSLQYWMVLERNKHYKNLLHKNNELNNSLQNILHSIK